MHQKYSRKSSSYPVMCEEIEDTKGVIRIRKSKTDRQHNCQKKKDKRTNNDLQNTKQKTKDRTKQFICYVFTYFMTNKMK
jgi:hypothetical protein